jgi:hypothetical protein
MCGANVGANSFGTATNTASPANPGGIFVFQNACGAAPYPAGSNAFLRILENQSSGNAGVNAYGRMWWDAPTYITILEAGGYTREPDAFNDGWRARFWGEGYEGSVNNILMQGAGVQNGSLGGIGWATTQTFASHLWPFGGIGNYRRFVFEMTCVREAGCDRSGFNATDANSFQLVLNDGSPSQMSFTGSTPLLAGQWVRGSQNVGWVASDQGSGLRYERLYVDNSVQILLDWGPQCNIGTNSATGEFARDFRPCPVGSTNRDLPINTATISDGVHTMRACSQDYGQAVGLDGTGGESCDQRTIRTDNQPPAAPGGLTVLSANPARYLNQFGAKWTLPPDAGSPITKVHYNIVDAAGNVVVPEQTVAGTNPTEMKAITGPNTPGDYRLRVWLEDTVGFVGPASVAAIPHDTTPPAAPQGISVTEPSTPRSADGLDVRWHNIVDAGSPINAVNYQVLNGAGDVVVPTKTVNGDNIQAIQDLETPNDRGSFTMRLWLSDAEDNVGAPVSAPLSYDCVRSTIGGGQQLTAVLGASTTKTVAQGDGATLTGYLRGVGGNIVGAPLCIFSRPVTDPAREFLGIAITGSNGDYRFAIPPGPSRDLSAVYRLGQRETTATSTIQTVVHPTFTARRRVVRNKHFAYFDGEIPGPHNDQVVIVLQAKVGKGWLAFHRYRTRNDGHFELAYRFNRTTRPTNYEMRAQVRETTGYPYLQGDSDPLILRVLPDRPKRHLKSRCGKHKRVVKGHKTRCGKSRGKSGARGHHRLSTSG